MNDRRKPKHHHLAPGRTRVSLDEHRKIHHASSNDDEIIEQARMEKLGNASVDAYYAATLKMQRQVDARIHELRSQQ